MTNGGSLPADHLTHLARLFAAGYGRIEARTPLLALCLRASLLILVFMGIEKFLFDYMRLSEQAYANPVLIISAAEKIGTAGLLIAVLVVGLLAVYGRLLAPWSALDMGAEIRVFVVFLALLVAWPLSSFGYNYYYDQGYYLDRVVLLLLLLLIWQRPVFIYPFLVLAFVMLWQLDVPQLSNGAHIPHKTQLLHVLCMFAASFVLYGLTSNPRTDDFLFLSCCLVAAVYWQPALSKLYLNWMGHGQLYHMPLTAHANGWLAAVPTASVVEFAHKVAWFDLPMRAAVMAIEVGSLFFLFRRSLSIVLLAAMIIFHLGVFLLFGYLFWTWILLDAALMVLLFRDRRGRRIRIYNTRHFLVSAILIGFGAHWCFPPRLGWYDTRLSYTFRYEAIGVSGESYNVPPRFFAPYDDVFTMASFNYLVKEHKALVTPYATTADPHVAVGLMRITTPEQVFSLESNLGFKSYDARREAVYGSFLSRYFMHRNQGEKEPALLAMLRSPRAFWSSGRGKLYRGQEPVTEVRVKEITTLFDDRKLSAIREITVLEIPIQPANEEVDP